MKKPEVAAKVKNWLSEEGFVIIEMYNETLDFKYVVSKDDIRLSIGSPKSSKDCLVIEGRVPLSESQQSMLKHTKTKKMFITELEIALLQMNCDVDIHKISKDNKEEFTVSLIEVWKAIFFEGLSKDRLFESMVLIYNAMRIILLKFDALKQN